MSSTVPPPVPPPLLNLPPPLLPVGKPGVVRWYRLWCALFVLVWLGMALHEFMVARGEIENLGLIEGWLVKDDQAAREELLAEKRQTAAEVAIVAIVVAVFYGVAACLPRHPGTWVVGLIALIATAFPFCIPLGGAIPLILHWVKPETKRYFGCRTAPPLPTPRGAAGRAS